MTRPWLGGVLLGILACDVPAEPVPEVWVTTADRRLLLERQALAPTSSREATMPAVTVDVSQTFQRMAGFGAAMTDAAANVMAALPAARRDALLQDLFGPGATAFSLVRVPIGASDFSLAHYTFNDVDSTGSDEDLRRFDVSGAATTLDITRRARAINPQLVVMATPWSAPAWMKDPRRLHGGTLRREAYATFARYLQRAVRAFDSAGVHVTLLSLQNEPHHEPADYPGMRLSPAQRATLFGEHVGPLFADAHPDVSLLEWDHNWDEPGSPLAVLADSAARRYVDGVAWHCYAGERSAQEQVHDAYPEVETWFTECSGGAWANDWGDNLLWNVKHLVIGTTRAWARGVLLWNLALDERHGPHLGGCANCRGVVTVHSSTGDVTRNEEYYALSHASRFVRVGAQRVTSRGGDSTLSHVAFLNPDGSRTLILVNEHREARAIPVVDRGRRWLVALPGRAVATVTWHE